jgi:hypothetical protein
MSTRRLLTPTHRAALLQRLALARQALRSLTPLERAERDYRLMRARSRRWARYQAHENQRGKG